MTRTSTPYQLLCQTGTIPVSHLATDRGGLNPLVRDVVDGLCGKPLAGSDGSQPYDQALHQVSEAGGGRANALCAIGKGSLCFEAVVDRAAKAAMSTYVNSQYDPAGLDSLFATLAEERGSEIDLSCSFNDRRFDAQTAPGAEVGEHEVLAALPATTFRWDPPLDKYGARYFLHIDGVPDAIQLCLFADTTVMPPKPIEEYLRDVEAVTVRSALSHT